MLKEYQIDALVKALQYGTTATPPYSRKHAVQLIKLALAVAVDEQALAEAQQNSRRYLAIRHFALFKGQALTPELDRVLRDARATSSDWDKASDEAIGLCQP